MNVYLVRAAGTTRVLGVFWAETVGDLRASVDEMDNPSRCEYAPLALAGGIFHDMPISEVLATGQADGEDDDPHLIHPLAVTSHNFAEELMGQDQLSWARFGG